MEAEIIEAQALLRDARAMVENDPDEAKAKVKEAILVLEKLFPKAPVGPDFPETETPPGGNMGGGGGGGQ